MNNYSSQDFLSVARRITYDANNSRVTWRSGLEIMKDVLSDKGAICVTTGKHTGRSPKDRFIVDTPDIHDLIHWSNTNQTMFGKYI